ncbi:MAG: dinitrogenase iron-molybdenum cofactor [Clostridia bacterium]|nr:dinitrogenase iron-molybdenum cofactor [Clostridia bacterium]
MRIGVATEGNMVAAHFGHCPHYSLFDVEDGKIVNKELVASPPHQPGVLPPFLGNLGVNCVIVGGIGARAVELFRQQGIEVIMGASGPVEEVVKAYLNGEIESSGTVCSHEHGEHGGCGN